MLFVSRYANLRFPVLREKRKPLGVNEYNEVQYEILLPDFTVEFDTYHLLLRDRLAAFAALTGRGWIPSTVASDGVIQDPSSPDMGKFFEADHPEYRMGVFDTEDERCIPAHMSQYRELIEQKMLEALKDSRDFVLVEPEKLTPPWPNYDTLDGRSLAKALQKIEDDGYDLALVLAYEKASKNRESWVKAFEDRLATIAQKRAEDASLEVSIG